MLVGHSPRYCLAGAADAQRSERVGDSKSAGTLLSYRRESVAPAPTAPQAPQPARLEVADQRGIQLDSAVTPAADQLPTSVPARKLAPQVTSDLQPKAGPAKILPFDFPGGEMLTTAGAGLAIVLGLLLACVWLFRRTGAGPGRPLPAEAFAVLGRAPLFGQTAAHLLRLGNKLVLVAVTPDGVQPIVEVTDRDEVDRLTGICAAHGAHSSSVEFQHVLRQLAQEPAKGFLGREGKRR